MGGSKFVIKKIKTIDQDLEGRFAFQVLSEKLPKPERQFKFLNGRKYRADFAWPKEKLIVEIDGGCFSSGKSGHTSISGMMRDKERDALAQIAGWDVIRIDAKSLSDGRGIGWVKQWFEERIRNQTKIH